MMAIAVILTAAILFFLTVVIMAILKVASESDDEEELLRRMEDRITKEAEKGMAQRDGRSETHRHKQDPEEKVQG